MDAKTSQAYADASVGICAVALFAVAVFPRLQPKHSYASRAGVIFMWFWTTTTWAKGTKMLVKEYGVHGLPPSATFWLTMVPQLLSCCVLLALVTLKGEVGLVRRSLRRHEVEGVDQSLSWYAGGACYFYGQLLTVVALTGSSPMVVFVIKAIEPLSTALLAIPILGQPCSLHLFVGLIVSCAGIVATQVGTHHIAPHGVQLHTASLTIVAAMLANLGFSGRACMVKQAYGRMGSHPVAALTTLSVSGMMMGLLPMLVWPSALFFYSMYTTQTPSWDRPVILADLNGEAGRLWVSTSLSYCIYQCSSLLILDCIAVESHALLVAVKHVFTAVLSAIMVGEHLSPMSLAGAAVTAAGIALFSAAPSPNTQKGDKMPGDDPEKAVLRSRSTGPSIIILCTLAATLTSAGTGAVFLQAGK